MFRKLSMTFAMLAALIGFTANAENSISIADVEVDAEGTAVVPVVLNNDADLYALEFSVSLPEGLEIEGGITPTDRVPLSAGTWSGVFNPEKKVWQGVYFPNPFTTVKFTGESGTPVAHFKVKADLAKLEEVSSLDFEVKDIYFVNRVNDANVDSEQAAFKVKVMQQQPNVELTATPSPFGINPGQKAVLTIAMDNAVVCEGLTFHMILPAGLTVESVDKTDRVPESCSVSAKALEDKGFTNFMLFNFSGNAVTGNTGDFLKVNIVAAKDFAGEGEITVNEVTMASDGAYKDIYGKGFTVQVVSGNEDYAAAQAKVAELEKNFADALAKIAEVAPDVADQFKGEDIAAEIAALKQAVEDAYKAGAVNFDEQMAQADAIAAKITALVADAEKAQADKVEGDRVAANQAAYDADMAQIAKLRKDLKNTILDIQADYKAYEDVRAQAAVEDAIDEAEAAVKAAFAAVAEEGTYTSPLDAEALTAQINGLLEAAKAKADRDAANKAAYQADLDRLAGLQGDFDLAKVIIDTKYPTYKDPIAETQISNALKNAATAIERAYAAVAKEGTYESPVDLDAIDAQIKALVADAQAKANAAAAQADLDKLNALYDLLESGKADLPEDEYTRLKAMVDGLAEEINDALAAANENGTDYVSPANLDSRVKELEGNIKTAIDLSGIADIIANPEQSGAQIFNLQGQQITNPAKGQVVIVRTATTTAKVVVK